MKLSLLPIPLTTVFFFSVLITRRALKRRHIGTFEAQRIYLLLAAFFFWTLAAVLLGLLSIHQHPSVLKSVPMLWQAIVPVIILVTALSISPTLRKALSELALHTPLHWLVFVQALRIGAFGGVLKGLRGDITSSYVWWVGIPDFLYGLSAILIGWLVLKRTITARALTIWSFVGPAIILLPTFVFMNHFMSEPGFVFIFEFPMVLAPSIVVPLLIFFNFLMAWGLYRSQKPSATSITGQRFGAAVSSNRQS